MRYSIFCQGKNFYYLLDKEIRILKGQKWLPTGCLTKLIPGTWPLILTAWWRISCPRLSLWHNERYNIHHLRYDDIVEFDLVRCLQMDEAVVWEILDLLLNRPEELDIVPLPDAVPVLTRLAQKHPLLFVTARDKAEPIFTWLTNNLPQVSPEDIRIIATGDPEAKLEYLQDHNIAYFMEDRLETCFIWRVTAFNLCFTISRGIAARILFLLSIAGRIWPSLFFREILCQQPDLGGESFCRRTRPFLSAPSGKSLD